MFSTVEKFSGPAKILLGVIALTFVGFGASSMATSSSDYLVQIGERKITAQAVRLALQNARANGDEKASEQSMFQALKERAYLLEGAKAMGIEVSLDKLKQKIVSVPAFQENGTFSQAKFDAYLKQAGISEDQFVKDEEESMILDSLVNLGRDGTVITDSQAKQLLELTQSARMVRSLTINPQAFVAQVKVDEAALKGFYEEHKADYVLPEAVKFQYAVLSLQDLAAKQTVSEDELKTAFEQSVNSKKPRRSVQHILIPLGNSDAEKAANKALADKVEAEAKADPAKFGSLAKQYSQDPATAANEGNLGLIQQGGGLPKAFEDKAFSMQKGEVSGVLATEYGYHIIKLNDIQEKGTLEQDRQVLETELKMKKAQQAFNKAKEELATAAFNTPNSLDPVAQKLGLKITNITEWVSKQEAEKQVADHKLSADFVKALFSDDVMKKKHNSEPVTVSDSAAAVVRVSEVRPQSQQTFEQVQADVKTAYVRAEAFKRAQDKAKQDLVDLQTGEKVDLPWSPPEKMTAAQATQALPPQAYQTWLKAKPAKDKPAYFLAEGLPVPVLVAVDSILPPENMDNLMPQAKQELLRGETNSVFESLMAYLQTHVPQKQGSQKLQSDNG